MTRRVILAALLPTLLATPALAQHVHAPAPVQAEPAEAAPGFAADPAHVGHVMDAAPEATGSPEPVPAEPEIPDGPPLPEPTDHAADRYYSPARMAAARRQLRLEHGGAKASQVRVSLMEHRARSGDDGYLWEAEAWFGGDLNRLVVKSEGEGGRDEGVADAEVQVLYSRAIGPYFDLQSGVRQDLEPGARTYAVLGIEGLAPYWFDVDAAVFLSTRCDLLARTGGSFDLRLSQRLILQPRAELNWSAQAVPSQGLGSGLTDAEVGLRLRYEVRPTFAPYIGVTYERRFGATGDLARAAGETAGATNLVIGLRAFF